METLKMHSLDGVQRNIDLIGKLFPNAITEVKRNGKVEHAIDFDVLRQELSDSIVEGREERYQFTWPDKKKAMLAANAPITATLRPVVADSVGKDGTPGGFDSENLYIEGDNLEVLKLLQETYLGKVKMIYIDPPYNTGKDFVYEDDFAQSTEDYMGNSGQYDEEGNRMVTNTESNGRFHTDWLNMIYPRLKLAKDLLSDDGAIFISIDDNELYNLKKYVMLSTVKAALLEMLHGNALILCETIQRDFLRKQNIFWCIANNPIGFRINCRVRIKWMQLIKTLIMIRMVHGKILHHTHQGRELIREWFMLYSIHLQESFFTLHRLLAGDMTRRQCWII